jgi:hypothetical protein
MEQNYQENLAFLINKREHGTELLGIFGKSHKLEKNME